MREYEKRIHTRRARYEITETGRIFIQSGILYRLAIGTLLKDTQYRRE